MFIYMICKPDTDLRFGRTFISCPFCNTIFNGSRDASNDAKATGELYGKFKCVEQDCAQDTSGRHFIALFKRAQRISSCDLATENADVFSAVSDFVNNEDETKRYIVYRVPLAKFILAENIPLRRSRTENKTDDQAKPIMWFVNSYGWRNPIKPYPDEFFGWLDAVERKFAKVKTKCLNESSNILFDVSVSLE